MNVRVGVERAGQGRSVERAESEAGSDPAENGSGGTFERELRRKKAVNDEQRRAKF